MSLLDRIRAYFNRTEPCPICGGPAKPDECCSEEHAIEWQKIRAW